MIDGPWSELSDAELEALVEERSLSACPQCGLPVGQVTSRGPMDHRAAPCGCRLGASEVQEL